MYSLVTETMFCKGAELYLPSLHVGQIEERTKFKQLTSYLE